MNGKKGKTDMTTGYPFDEIRTCLAAFPGIELAIVYGSYAKGNAGTASDVDMAVAAAKPLGMQERIALYTALSSALKREVDLVDLRTAEGIFLHRIMRDGKRAVETKDGRQLFLRYRQKALYFYADYYPIYRRDRDIRLKRIFRGERHGS